MFQTFISEKFFIQFLSSLFFVSHFCRLVYLILHIICTILVFTTIFLLSINSRVYFVHFLFVIDFLSVLPPLLLNRSLSYLYR